MKNWKLLNDEEYNQVWGQFEKLFHFSPSGDEFPYIETSLPQMIFDIQDCYSVDYSFVRLEELALDLFQKITKPCERMYAFDWQHHSFDFNPRLEMDKNEEFDEWIIPIFPNGDYYIFLKKDFSNVWFGHPWKMTITLIGNEMVSFREKIKNDFENINIHLKDL